MYSIKLGSVVLCKLKRLMLKCKNGNEQERKKIHPTDNDGDGEIIQNLFLLVPSDPVFQVIYIFLLCLWKEWESTEIICWGKDSG
jgi:hypothetical protein